MGLSLSCDRTHFTSAPLAASCIWSTTTAGLLHAKVTSESAATVNDRAIAESAKRCKRTVASPIGALLAQMDMRQQHERSLARGRGGGRRNTGWYVVGEYGRIARVRIGDRGVEGTAGWWFGGQRRLAPPRTVLEKGVRGEGLQNEPTSVHAGLGFVKNEAKNEPNCGRRYDVAAFAPRAGLWRVSAASAAFRSVGLGLGGRETWSV